MMELTTEDLRKAVEGNPEAVAQYLVRKERDETLAKAWQEDREKYKVVFEGAVLVQDYATALKALERMLGK